MTDFSLDLNEDQLQIQKWVHDFAADVIRPAGPEWDEREEMPWSIIEEAAKIGLYSMDFIANAFGDPTGITFPVVSEELAWGDAGITLALLSTTLGVSGILGNGTPAVSTYDEFRHLRPSQMPLASAHAIGNSNLVKADVLFKFLRDDVLPTFTAGRTADVLGQHGPG